MFSALSPNKKGGKAVALPPMLKGLVGDFLCAPIRAASSNRFLFQHFFYVLMMYPAILAGLQFNLVPVACSGHLLIFLVFIDHADFFILHTRAGAHVQRNVGFGRIGVCGRGKGGKCGRCEFRSVCGGSRARAYGMTGDPFAQDPACNYQPKRPG